MFCQNQTLCQPSGMFLVSKQRHGVFQTLQPASRLQQLTGICIRMMNIFLCSPRLVIMSQGKLTPSLRSHLVTTTTVHDSGLAKRQLHTFRAEAAALKIEIAPATMI
jgi:hypothetical protein